MAAERMAAEQVTLSEREREIVESLNQASLAGEELRYHFLQVGDPGVFLGDPGLGLL